MLVNLEEKMLDDLSVSILEYVEYEAYKMIGKHLPPLNPEDILSGKCATCGTEIKMPRYEARAPHKHRDITMFGELYTCECPHCKKIVDEAREKQHPAVKNKQLYLPKPSGTMVYLSKVTDAKA